MKVCVIGAGYVGLTSSAVIAELGHEVICVDKDETKINQLNSGLIPIYEPGLSELLNKNAERLSFSIDIEKAIKESSIIMIAVGTPSLPDGSTNLTYIYSVIEDLASSIESYKTIITKSTVPPGTNEMIDSMLSTKIKPSLFNVVSNPEFLREGTAVKDMLFPDKTLIGIKPSDKKSIDIMKKLYQGLEAPFIITTLTGAELTKYASNAFLAMKISFINEIARLCEAYDVDVMDVAKGIGTDPRIGSQFLRAGLGYGGSCFPKDVSSLHHTAQKKKVQTPILEAIQDINRTQVKEYISKLIKLVPELSAQKIAVLGISFKPDTDDIRYSKAIEVIEELAKIGCEIHAYDPIAFLPKGNLGHVIQGKDLDSVIKDAHCLFIATEWTEFSTIDWQKVKGLMSGNIIVDGRNCLNKENLEKMGFYYLGVGRG